MVYFNQMNKLKIKKKKIKILTKIYKSTMKLLCKNKCKFNKQMNKFNDLKLKKILIY